MKTSKWMTMLFLGSCLSAVASPVEDFPRSTVIEGLVSPATDDGPAIMVNNRKVFLDSNTLIRSPLGTLKPSELRVGMMVRVEGTPVPGGLMARTIHVFSR